MDKKNKRTEQAQRTKNLLMQEALEQMKVKNFDDITIQELCRAVGVSVGAFYHHFNGKSGIIVEAYAQFDDFVEREIITSLDLADVRRAIVGYLCQQGLYGQNKGVDLIRNVYKAQMDNASEFFLSEDRTLPKGLRDLVRQGMERGELTSEKTAEAITRELLIITRGILYHWALSKGSYNICDTVDSIVTAYLCSM